MATEHGPCLDLTLKAAGSLATKQFYFVKISGDDTVDVCAAATDIPIGVLQNTPDAAGKPAIVRVVGVSKVSSDAALTAGNIIGTSGDGQADAKAVTDTNDYVVGQVLVGSGAAAGLAEATINCLNPTRAN